MAMEKILIIAISQFFFGMHDKVTASLPTAIVGHHSNMDDSIDIRLKKNYLNNESIIILYLNKEPSDSIILKNVDLRFDSIVNYNNIFWHYLFAVNTKCRPQLEYKYQMILTFRNKKLHISFIAPFIKKCPWSGKPFYNTQPDDTSQNWEEIKKNSIFQYLSLDSNFFNGKLSARHIYYAADNFDRDAAKGVSEVHKFEYDSTMQIFFDLKREINTTCLFELTVDGDEILKKLNNEKVYFLSYFEDSFAFYNGQWYFYFGKYNQNYFRPLEIIFDYCKAGEER